MRRKDREVTDLNRILNIIEECDIIHIGLNDGDYPYIVPLNFGYHVEEGKISFYIHGAVAGRKYELLKRNGKCSFEMEKPLKMDLLYQEKDVTMRYKSVMGTADVELLEGEEKQKALDQYIMGRYEETRIFDYNKDVVPRTMVARLTVTDISAKENPMR